ncbi:hypothetical protein AERO9AM_30607 [Aeromicrobium sp. 9AM]|nr:hypothetical protein AERO9AM_30607 [Aeromicrobium sp. 9AM]
MNLGGDYLHTRQRLSTRLGPHALKGCIRVYEGCADVACGDLRGPNGVTLLEFGRLTHRRHCRNLRRVRLFEHLGLMRGLLDLALGFDVAVGLVVAHEVASGIASHSHFRCRRGSVQAAPFDSTSEKVVAVKVRSRSVCFPQTSHFPLRKN